MDYDHNFGRKWQKLVEIGMLKINFLFFPQLIAEASVFYASPQTLQALPTAHTRRDRHIPTPATKCISSHPRLQSKHIERHDTGNACRRLRERSATKLYTSFLLCANICCGAVADVVVVTASRSRSTNERTSLVVIRRFQRLE